MAIKAPNRPETSKNTPNRLKKWEKHRFGKKVPKDTWRPKRHHLTQKWPLRHQIDQKIVKIIKLLKKRQKGTQKIYKPEKKVPTRSSPMVFPSWFSIIRLLPGPHRLFGGVLKLPLLL